MPTRDTSGSGAQIHLTASLQAEGDEQAVSVLQAYYAPLTDPGGGFTGGQFDSFDPSGTRHCSADVFTADDVIAVSLLSVRVASRAVLKLLDTRREQFRALLADVGPDRDLVGEGSTEPAEFPADALYWALRDLPDVGPTTASKLLARKRPRLMPINDSVVNTHLLDGSGVLWEPLRLALRADDCQLHKRLLRLRQKADLTEHVSALRVLDVITWMDGSGHTSRLLQQEA